MGWASPPGCQTPMREVAPGWRLQKRAQALFANPDILPLDEPTNNLTSTPVPPQ